jgi:hypothetical protein
METRKILRILFLILLIFSGGKGLYAQYEEAAIKEVIREAYENGYHNEGIARNLELGFSPEFRAVNIVDGALKIQDLQDWINEVNSGNARSSYPAEGKERYSIFYHRLDLNGNIAHAKINLKKGGTPVALEYIEIFKSPTGWVILSLTRIPMDNSESLTGMKKR